MSLQIGYIVDIDSVEQIAQLCVGLPSHIFIHQFHTVAPNLKMLGPDTLRQVNKMCICSYIR